MTRRVLALLAVLAGIATTGLAFAAPASAHATVVTSTPVDGSRLSKAPATVTVVFDENVGIGGVGYLHVTNGAGKRVDAGPAFHPNGDGAKLSDRLQPGLGAGTYTASFRIVSADSHPVAGTIRFVVGNGALAHGSVPTGAASTSASSALDVARWVTYAGLAVLGGVWLLLTVWPEGRDDPRARRLVWTGWAGAVAGALAELLLQGPYSAGSGALKFANTTLIDNTLHSTYGQLHSVRLVLLGLFALLLARSMRTGAARAPVDAAAGLLGVGVAVTVSAAGHADTTNPNWLSIPLDTLHLLAMAAWVGGLVMLLVAVLPRREPGESAAAVPAFSSVAFVSVVVLALTGTYAAWRGIGTVHAILTTTYGLLVLAKVVLFVGLIALGNVSRGVVRRRYRPRAVAFAMTDAVLLESEDEPARTDEQFEVEHERLRRAVVVETAIALIVLALTSVLVAEPRGREALAAQYREPVRATAPYSSGHRIAVTSDPGTHGTVQLTVDLGTVRPKSVTATATQPDKQIGPVPVPLTRVGAETYDGSVALPAAGRWRIDLVVTTSAFDATTTSATLTLH